MAPPPTTVVSPVIGLLIRLLTFFSLIVSLVILTTNTATIFLDIGDLKVRFSDVYAYRYMAATIVIGIAYTLLQIAFAILLVTTGKRIGGEGLCLFDFYADKVLSYLLATGAAAGLAVTIDLRSGFVGDSIHNFFNKANASASLLLLGFVFSAVSSVFSSLSLPKRN